MPQKFRILICEDDKHIRESLEELLEEEFEILQATDGVEALHILHTQKIHALLIDLMLPRLDGGMLLTTIAKDEALRDIPRAIISTYNNAAGTAGGLGIPFFRKPLDIHPIEEWLRRVCK